MLRMIYGPTGSGKNQLLVHLGLRSIAKGRPVYTNFALNGARRLLDIRDCIVPDFAGALFLFDEAGTSQDARSTFENDEMVKATLSQHRKNVRPGFGGVDIYMTTQES